MTLMGIDKYNNNNDSQKLAYCLKTLNNIGIDYVININDIERTAIKIQHLKELTTNIIKGVRTATFNLTPPELSDHGIVPAIAKLAKELGKLTGKEILFFNK